jgi:hypothetical protein
MVEILSLLLMPVGIYAVVQACSKAPARRDLYLDRQSPDPGIRSMPLFYAVFVLYAAVVTWEKLSN